jgi:hypothetical protein
MAVSIRIHTDPRLKDLAGRRADALGLPLSELVVRALATYLDRPDLAVVPRKKMGRPRKPIPSGA